MSIVEEAVKSWPEVIRSFLKKFPGVELPVKEPRSIVISGIGSSAAGGLFLEPISPVPVVISRDVVLPRFVSPKDLVLICSYSGNTPETLLSLRDALARGINPVVLTSGGKLLSVAEELGLPLVKIEPGGYTSRAMVGLIITATIATVDPIVNARNLLEKVPDVLAWAIKDEENIRSIALRIGGRAIVSVGYGPYKPGMKRIVAEFRENSKLPAFYVELPEGNHNYYVTLGHPGVIHLYPEHERRSSLAKHAFRLNDKEHVPIRVSNRGFLGNFEILIKAALSSIRLARLLGRDPDDIRAIEEIKKKFLEEMKDVFKRI